MNNKYVYNLIDRLLQEIMGVNVSFGGKVFVMCGDIRQTLPVMKGNKKTHSGFLSNKIYQKSVFIRS